MFSKLFFNFSSLSFRNFSFASFTATSLMELISFCWLTIDLVSSAVMVLEALVMVLEALVVLFLSSFQTIHGVLNVLLAGHVHNPVASASRAASPRGTLHSKRAARLVRSAHPPVVRPSNEGFDNVRQRAARDKGALLCTGLATRLCLGTPWRCGKCRVARYMRAPGLPLRRSGPDHNV